MSSNRIPRKIAEFNSYIRNTDDYLQTENPGPPPIFNWLRLGLTNEMATQWHNFRQGWDALYVKHSNPETKTKVVNMDVVEAMDEFRAVAQPMLDIMAASPNAIAADAVVFNFKIGHADPTHPVIPIAETCYINVKNIGTARVKFSFRTDTEGGRASLPHDADSVQVAYKIGGTPPTTAEDGTQQFTITRASDIRDLGLENVGQVCYVFARWFSMRHQNLAGAWSPMTTVRL